MDKLLKELLVAPGISGYEEDVAAIMKRELIIATKKGEKKAPSIMLASHMDEIGLMVRYIDDNGFIKFSNIGGINDQMLMNQTVTVHSSIAEPIVGVIGSKPPHLQTAEERKKLVTYDNMFIDIGCSSKEEVLKKVEIGDQIIFEPNAGVLNGDVYYGKAIDNRAGCYEMLKIMEKINVDAEVYAVATAQEEVGLKGARTSSFAIDPDFALILDTNVAGDVPGIEKKVCSLKIGSGIGITMIEASGRGTIVNNKVRRLMIDTAKENKIKHQIDIVDGGMTDGAVVYMNRSGILTGILSIPTRYLHAATSVFNIKDLQCGVDLSLKVIEKIVK